MRNSTKYIVEGRVRGHISSHRTLAAAVRSMQRDHNSCGKLRGGAYSDAVVKRANGSRLSEDEADEVDSLTTTKEVR